MTHSNYSLKLSPETLTPLSWFHLKICLEVWSPSHCNLITRIKQELGTSSVEDYWVGRTIPVKALPVKIVFHLFAYLDFSSLPQAKDP